MADLRILQEQTQQLQALMNDLGEALKAVNSRIEDQTSLERKAFADGKVQMDTMSGDLRVVREKVDETNVRLGTITQELESLRQAIPEPGAMPPAARQHRRRRGTRRDARRALRQPTAATPPVAAAGRSAAAAVRQLRAATTPPATTRSRSRGSTCYLRSFPKSTRAHEAQLYIGEALAWEKKDMEAVAAYDRVIANYPGSASVPHGVLQARAWRSSGSEKPRARESRTKR